MEVILYRSFIQVANLGSFSKAAKLLCITQSAVSQHIKTLEEELGCVLMLRHHGSVTLTEAGVSLLPYAKNALKAVQECQEHISALNGCLKGELHIGVGSCIEPIVRMAAFKMMEMYPGVTLHVEFAKASRLNKMLRDHTLDLAFTINTAHKEEGIESVPCIPFHIHAIMSKTHVLATKEKVTFQDLCQHNVIMPDVSERVFETLQQYIHEDFTKLRVCAVVSSDNPALSAVGTGKYITFLPKAYIDDRPTLTSRPIEGLEMELMSNAHCMKDVPLKNSAKIFLDIVNEYSVPLARIAEE